MSITLDVKALRAAAGEAASVAVSAKDAAPIFANVLIVEEDGGSVRFCATDLDTVLDRHLQAVQGTLARDPLRTTVSARYLSAIAAKLPDGAQVELTLDGNTALKVSSGRARFTLTTLAADDFPEFKEEDWDAEFSIKAAQLAAIIDGVGFAASTEETRYYLNGIFLHQAEGEDGEQLLRVAATDGHRLARLQIPLPEGAESLPKPGVILPRRSFGVVRKLIDHMPKGDEDGGPSVEISVSERRMRFDFGGADRTVLTTKLIDGTFPEYARVIPSAHDKLLKCDRAALFEAVERVATIVNERSRAVKVEVAKDMVTLTVASPEAGTAVEEVPGDYQAEPLTIGFNVRYLLDVLGKVEGATVVFELSDGVAAALIRAEAEDSNTLFVLMPLRV